MAGPRPALEVHRDAPSLGASSVPISTDDEIFNMEDAAAFFGKASASWLQRSDIPRAKIGGRVVFLRSQLIAYVVAHLSHRIDVPTVRP
jgi:hypothetical protein